MGVVLGAVMDAFAGAGPAPLSCQAWVLMNEFVFVWMWVGGACSDSNFLAGNKMQSYQIGSTIFVIQT